MNEIEAKRETRRGKTVLSIVALAAVLLLSATFLIINDDETETVSADTAVALRATINSYDGGGLTAAGSGNTVIVTGTKTNATTGLTLNIDAGVVVIWRASLTTNSAVYNSITISGAGTFTVESMRIENNYSGAANPNAIVMNGTGVINIRGGVINANNGTGGRAILVDNDNAVINMTGGTVSTTSATAIYVSRGTVNISGGTVSTTTRVAIYVSSGTVNISGGTVSAMDGGQGIQISSGTVSMTGGTVSATTVSAIYSIGGTVNIFGGTVSASATTGRAIEISSGTVYISQASKDVPTLITSANGSGTSGTIYFSTAAVGTVNISSGTVNNTVGGNIIYKTANARVTAIPNAEISAQSTVLEKVYDGAESMLYVSVSNQYDYPAVRWYKDGVLLLGENSLTLSVSDVSDSGAYECWVRNKISNWYEAYWVVSDPIFVNITPKTVNVTADAVTKTVGDADPVLTYTHTGLFGDDAFTGSLARTPGTTMGTYAITKGTLQIAGSGSGNYIMAFAGNWLTITEATADTTPTIGANGNWYIGSVDTGVRAAGADGTPGATGAQGPKGDKGDKGDDGADGTPGATGAQGPKGDKGDKGDDGADGKDGTDATAAPLSSDNGGGNNGGVTVAGVAVGMVIMTAIGAVGFALYWFVLRKKGVEV